MYRRLVAGATSQMVEFPVYDSSSATGALLTGLVFNTGSLSAYYNRQNAAGATTAISLVTMTKGTWTSGGFVAVDATNMPGIYQLCIPDAAVAAAAGIKFVTIMLKGAANMVPVVLEFELIQAPDMPVDVQTWLGTAVTAATAGKPDVNVARINNIAATSVTAVNANQGTTQPLNFTGTAGSALVKGDTIDWNSTAVSAPSTAGVPDVNILNAGGTAWGSGAITDAVFGNTVAIKTRLSSTAQAGSLASITLNGGAVASDGFYVGQIISINSGAGQGQSRMIIAYVGASRVAYVSSPWLTQPNNTSIFSIAAGPGTIFLNTGLAQAGGASSITLAASASAVNNYYQGATVVIVAGTGAGQCCVISGYVGATQVATIGDPWGTAPDNTSVYAIIPTGDSRTVSFLSTLDFTSTMKTSLNAATPSATANVTQWNGVNVAIPNVAGVPIVDVADIDGQATSGNNATLNLKKLNIINTAGDALVAISVGGNGRGLVATGNGTGAGIAATGGATNAAGLSITGGGTNGSGIIAAGGSGAGSGAGMQILGTGTSSPGLYVTGGLDAVQLLATAGMGLWARGAGANPGAKFEGGATGDGLFASGGATSGSGIRGTAPNAGHGMQLSAGITSGDGLRSTSANGNGITAASSTANGIDSTGASIGINGSGTSIGIRAGSSSGDGIASFAGNNGSGMNLNGAGTGSGMLLTKGGGAGSFDLKGATPSSNFPTGSGLTAQQTRDAMKLAPTAGAPAAASIDQDLADIYAKVPTAADINTTLSAAHGNGAWDGVGPTMQFPMAISGQNNNIYNSGIYIYFGAQNTDGSWRESIQGTDVVFERRESGVWIVKGSFTI